MPKHALVAEIGVAAGDFSAKILAHTAPQTLHLIDSWSHDERFLNIRDVVTNSFAAEVAAGQVVAPR